MVLAAIILFTLAGILGLIMLTYVLQVRPVPKLLSFIYGPLAGIGLLILIIHAMSVNGGMVHFWSILLFIIAAAAGIYLFSSHIKTNYVPRRIAVFHSIIAIVALIILYINVFNQ